MDAEKSLKQKVVAYLGQLDLSEQQALAYIFLLEQGPQTVLALSRGLKTGRTKLYPLLENLADKQVITIHERHYGTSYEAQSPEVLEFLVTEKERQTEILRSDLKPVAHALEGLRSRSPATSKIIEYRGVDGLKQMNFNLSKAKKEFRVFEIASLAKHLGKHFAEKNRQRFADNNLTSYDLTNNPDWRLETEVDKYKKSSHARYIDPSVFVIEFETYVYNNCVALLSYEKDDIFGVEIYNEKLARQQTQIFDLLWSRAKILQ
jgi:sugar-specific transcriptional regulator TrmB